MSDSIIEDFPPLDHATPDGLIAIGGDLSKTRLVKAYRSGIFPWFNPGDPILWWSPDPRCVLYPQNHKLSRSTKKSLIKQSFTCSFDHAFTNVIEQCALTRRNQEGTWISQQMQRAYTDLHQSGIAHSVETWLNGQLVGGLYGIALGGIFFGESMFSKADNASKAALYYLVSQLTQWQFMLIDCQVTSAHLLSLGAEEIPRPQFKRELDQALTLQGQPGSWIHYEASKAIAP